MKKKEEPKINTANRYCHNCRMNFGGICERDGHRVAQYEWCGFWEGRRQ